MLQTKGKQMITTNYQQFSKTVNAGFDVFPRSKGGWTDRFTADMASDFINLRIMPNCVHDLDGKTRWRVYSAVFALRAVYFRGILSGGQVMNLRSMSPYQVGKLIAFAVFSRDSQSGHTEHDYQQWFKENIKGSSE